MIITPDEAAGQKSTPFQHHYEPPLDPPPLYVDIAPVAGPSNPTGKPLPRIPPPRSPSLTCNNHLDIQRSEIPIKGAWIVDTSLLPTSNSYLDLTTSASQRETKPNLRLVSQKYGIDAKVSLQGNKRARLDVISKNGPVVFNVVHTDSTEFLLNVKVRNGDACIHLPESFYGPVHCTFPSNDAPRDSLFPLFSPSMESQLTVLSPYENVELKSTTVSFFLGDLTDGSAVPAGPEWSADEVHVQLGEKSQVRFFWSNEVPPPPDSSGTLLDDALAKLKSLPTRARSWVPWRGKHEY
ncbi:hypothetical protein SISNIDRAFT_466104 [Sistotremastrum niveocremeum HHB9708]|uniref:DUF7330 domain-containing protein n=1 Tax=Sistotremastrum niveocremeum HHB9708 TaxID=1314777 RepID=A0A164UKE3_9AGAM|nr:hypothetical protein SISNIDRAFT_466104 [Sistotremastrum niveocremeum HHB9708]